MGEPAGTAVFVEIHLANSRHDGKLAVVVDPRTGLVGLFETPDLVGVVGVLPAVAHLARLRHPEVHAPGQGDGGIGVACGKAKFRSASH